MRFEYIWAIDGIHTLLVLYTKMYTFAVFHKRIRVPYVYMKRCIIRELAAMDVSILMD